MTEATKGFSQGGKPVDRDVFLLVIQCLDNLSNLSKIFPKGGSGEASQEFHRLNDRAAPALTRFVINQIRCSGDNANSLWLLASTAGIDLDAIIAIGQTEDR